MHLSASGSTLRNVAQKAWACSALVTSHSMFLLAVSMLVQRVAGPAANQQAIGALVNLAVAQTVAFGSLLNFWVRFDHELFDIPQEEEEQPQLYSRQRTLRINDLLDPKDR